MSSTLWVARHGETDWNRGRLLQGHRDPGLNDTGREQAVDLAERLTTSLGVGARPRGAARGSVPVFASDLKRAQETATYVVEALGAPLELVSGLRERMMGAVEGRTWEDLRRELPDAVAAYKEGRDRDAIPGMEPYAAFRARVLDATRAIARQTKLAVLVTHGGALRVLLEEAMGPDKAYVIGNGALYTLEVGDAFVRRVIR